MQYPLAAQELNKCLQLFLHQQHSNNNNKLGETSSGNVQPSEAQPQQANAEHDNEDGDGNGDGDEDDDDEQEIDPMVVSLKENIANIFFTNTSVDLKQNWQSLLWTVKSLLGGVDDATLILTRRGLSVLTMCFFHIMLIYQHQQFNFHHNHHQQHTWVTKIFFLPLNSINQNF